MVTIDTLLREPLSAALSTAQKGDYESHHKNHPKKDVLTWADLEEITISQVVGVNC